MLQECLVFMQRGERVNATFTTTSPKQSALSMSRRPLVTTTYNSEKTKDVRKEQTHRTCVGTRPRNYRAGTSIGSHS